MELNTELFRLIDACCEAYDNPAFKPRDGMTFCNQAVKFINERVGFMKFGSMTANQMVGLLKGSNEWTPIPFEEAQTLANQGRLVIAGFQHEPHGHVAVIRPGLPSYSNKWNCAVPKVINVGAENFIAKPINWAFRDKPNVFVWNPPISKA